MKPPNSSGRKMYGNLSDPRRRGHTADRLPLKFNCLEFNSGYLYGLWFLFIVVVVIVRRYRVVPANEDIGMRDNILLGGRATQAENLSKDDMLSYGIEDTELMAYDECTVFTFLVYGLPEKFTQKIKPDSSYVYYKIPLHVVTRWLNVKELRIVARNHNVLSNSRTTRDELMAALGTSHHCKECDLSIACFETSVRKKKSRTSIKYEALFTGADLAPFTSIHIDPLATCSLEGFVRKGEKHECNLDGSIVRVVLPELQFCTWASLTLLKNAVAAHGLEIGSAQRNVLINSLLTHECACSSSFEAVVRVISPDCKTGPSFPPEPPSKGLLATIIRDWCEESKPDNINEAGCAVCAQLWPAKHLVKLTTVKHNMNILRSDRTRKERKASSEPICPLSRPVLAPGCDAICPPCNAKLAKESVPSNSLANGLWLGEVPEELKNLSFAEKLVIQRVLHTRCVTRVTSGRMKMTANVVMLALPTPKIYHKLPPSREELDEMLAVVFMGIAPPTADEIIRTPLLVRRLVITKALEWLKLNHVDYYDLEISRENLEQYPENGIPVTVLQKIIKEEEGNKTAGAMSVHDNEDEEGTETGPCSFTVTGLTGAEFATMSAATMKAVAMRHLDGQGKVLGIGHGEHPLSMYDNPQMYPQMFPWLFPYGYGGIGQKIHKGVLSEDAIKRHFLMYYDKRFQYDPYFPMVAFNHKQIKNAVKGSFLMTKREKFPEVIERLKNMNSEVLIDISARMLAGRKVVPESEDERACFALLDDIDHVGGHVEGSLTSKKFMRNELWSLTAFQGAPSWFVTFSPTDSKHPLCFYFADTKTEYKPDILRDSDERDRLVAANPVAASRFFHHMVSLFIKHVLGVKSNHRGIYGNTAAYYGTVEQQGRLTLHLHMLIWVENALSPQKIRDRLMQNDSEFGNAMKAYLEGCHRGEFMTGTMADVQIKYPVQSRKRRGVHALKLENSGNDSEKNKYQDPTLTLPIPPPLPCEHPQCMGCQRCRELEVWWSTYSETVDDLVLKSNHHRCHDKLEDENVSNVPNTKEKKPKLYKTKGCLNREGVCTARFPRTVHAETVIDTVDGRIEVKKGEAWINTYSDTLTYLARCNTDVTSLLSGTAIKAIVAYVSDYVTKTSLKTHQIFSSAYDVFAKRGETMDGLDDETAARRVILKIVNSLSIKLEVGSPMACLYLLGNPDRYTSHKFVPFYWKSYVAFVQGAWRDDIIGVGKMENVILGKANQTFYAKSLVYDYCHRPAKYGQISLYSWIQGASKKTRSKEDIEKLIKSVENQTGECFSMNVEDGVSVIAKMSDTEVPDVEENGQGKGSQSGLFDTAFLPAHPQFWSHSIHFSEKKTDAVVPNFIGGGLPRNDQGDKEYYCATMLTFFRPWRTGFELKNEGESWESAFSLHSFSRREVALMENFNLRYECNDSRDDYHAQLKVRTKAAKSAFHPPKWVPDEEEEPYGTDHGHAFEYTADMLGMPSPRARKHEDAQDNLKTLMKCIHYHEPCTGDNVEIRTPALSFTEQKGPAYWTKIVADQKKMNLKKNKCDAGVDADDVEMEDGTTRAAPFESVKILPHTFFINSKFMAERKEDQRNLDSTAAEFALNEAQERAFKIVGNHASISSAEQLLMYLGGMGGTGKSQVFKAWQNFFTRRGESNRILVIAPTGSAAANVGGSTIHSALGMRTGFNVEFDTLLQSGEGGLRKLREKLQAVDYILIDEISMIACDFLYLISARLSEIFNRSDVPFGGKNIIAAGDFAQLPPPHGTSLYCGTVGTLHHARQTIHQQENTLGKIFWHQFTTVVMLKENMRQKNQSLEDDKFRACLGNMRFASCSKEDLRFLASRIIGSGPDAPSLTDPAFRNQSVITGLNIVRDTLNEEGCKRFAKDRKLDLKDFYSVDRPGLSGKRGTVTPRQLGEKVKQLLWNLPPSYGSSQVAGKLSLCVGMPVIIKRNEATELCITNGQEAHVVCWDDAIGPDYMPVLNVVFVELHNPPTSIQLPGLPPNVVPLSRCETTLTVETPDGTKLNIKRLQVVILPNFSISDFCSQGRNRNPNPIHLATCRSYQAYYTALSRGTCASSIMILDGKYSESLITRGISGYLRQEFRDFEILNDMTKDMYDNVLPPNIRHALRYPSLRAYRLWKGADYSPSWHKALAWDVTTNSLEEPEENRLWQKKQDDTIKVFEKNTKRKHQENRGEITKNKRPRLEVTPVGPVWDPINWSCAYDVLLMLLYNIWFEDAERWSRELAQLGPLMSFCVEGFESKTKNLNDIRNGLRTLLREQNINDLPMGAVGTDIHTLIRVLMGIDAGEAVVLHCPQCESKRIWHFRDIKEYTSLDDDSQRIGKTNIAQILENRLKERVVCNTCLRRNHMSFMNSKALMQKVPSILMLPMNAAKHTLDPYFTLGTKNVPYSLKGIIYHGNFHFVCRFADGNGNWWYHDGQKGSSCQKERKNVNLSRSGTDFTAVVAVYVKHVQNCDQN